MDRPDTLYTWNEEIALAYQVMGRGAIDLIHLPGFTSNVELNWDSPKQARFLRRLATFSRLIVMDRRGWGCSDRLTPGAFPPLETLADDVLAVMDAAGSDRTTVFATGDSGLLGLLFAASHPERVSTLILYDTTPSFVRRDDMPWLDTRDELERTKDFFRGWGTRAFAREGFAIAGPSELDDPHEFEWYVRFLRLSGTPGAQVAELEKYWDTDVRNVLPSIRVPTLVLHRTEAKGYNIETARYLTSHIPQARLVELPGQDLAHWYGDADRFADEIEEFVTGVRHESEHDRVLATMLFVDVVGSTDLAAKVGDRRWSELLGRFQEVVHEQVRRYRGHEMNWAGDGFLATFDGPARAIRCAQMIGAEIRSLGLQVRAGCHAGEIQTGGDQIQGIAVHVAARVQATAQPEEVLVSSTVKDLVAGSGLVFEDRGEHVLKGVPEPWRLYSVIPVHEDVAAEAH